MIVGEERGDGDPVVPYYHHYSFIKDIQMIFCTVLGKENEVCGGGDMMEEGRGKTADV